MWLHMFLKVWNLFIELEDYKFYVQNFEFWSFGENLHIFKPISINVYHPAPASHHPPYLNDQLRHALIGIFESGLPTHLKRR